MTDAFRVCPKCGRYSRDHVTCEKCHAEMGPEVPAGAAGRAAEPAADLGAVVRELSRINAKLTFFVIVVVVEIAAAIGWALTH